METFSVKAVVKLTGINENTLRGWERRYGAITPERDQDGKRSYSSKEVERIKILWALVKEGHAIGKIANYPTVKLKKLLKTSLSPAAPDLNATSLKNQLLLNEMIKALRSFNLESLNQVLQKARFELSSKDIVFNLVRPLMEQVGQLVNEGNLSIAQEHLLSSLLRDFLGNLHQSLAPYDFSSHGKLKSMILTTREGDIHEFGILMSSILCNLYRFKTYYLGPNMPLDDLVDSALQLKVNTIILGVMQIPKTHEIISAQDYIRELDRRLPREVTICFGGSQNIDTEKFRSERIFVKFNDLSQLDVFLSQEL